jgi:hypothetical protein
MALTVKTVSVAEVTRYVSEGPNGLISADVTIDLEDSETGVAPVVTINVDLPGAEDLSFTQIEARSLVAALEVLQAVAGLDAGELERSYRAKFADQNAESLAG